MSWQSDERFDGWMNIGREEQTLSCCCCYLCCCSACRRFASPSLVLDFFVLVVLVGEVFRFLDLVDFVCCLHVGLVAALSCSCALWVVEF